MEPYKNEGPYDKCADWNLRGDPFQYYMLLIREGAKIAGLHKAGKLGDERLLRASFGDMADKDSNFFGMAVGTVSGEDARIMKTKYETGEKFVTDIGKVLFPNYVTDDSFKERFKTCILYLNGYQSEIQYWKHTNQDYIAVSHQNMNVDNAYFWRDDRGELHLGVFDWGGMGSMCLGHKIWWWIYCADYDVYEKHHEDFIKQFIKYYQEFGGPELEYQKLYDQMILTALQQLMALIKAVPQITTMCPKSRWATIEDRYQKCIAENIDGKSSLRLYLHVMVNVVRIMEERGGYDLLQNWIKTVWVEQFKAPRKPHEIVMGDVGTGFGL